MTGDDLDFDGDFVRPPMKTVAKYEMHPVGTKDRIAQLEAALREAIEYVLLDTEIPRTVRDWQNVLVPNAGLSKETKAKPECNHDWQVHNQGAFDTPVHICHRCGATRDNVCTCGHSDASHRRYTGECLFAPDNGDFRCNCLAFEAKTKDGPLCKPLCAHGKHAWERCQACEMDGGTGFTANRGAKR